jgi:hypothetical protein
MKNNFFWLYSLLLLNTIAMAGTIDPKAKDLDHVNYGNEYECVVVLHGTTEDNQRYTASAVLIKPNWILTAGHIVSHHSDHHILYKNQKININKIILPNNFDSNKFGQKDLAICRLESNVDLKKYPELYDTDDEIDKIAGLAGFGNTGTFSSGANIHDGLKRGGSNIIDKIEDDLLVCSVLRPPHTKMEFLIAIGDSGGGLFINQKLAGIHSGIWNYGNNSKPKSTYSTHSGHTRISIFREWILKNID